MSQLGTLSVIVASAWPAYLFVLVLIPQMKRGRIRERYWFLACIVITFVCGTALLVRAAMDDPNRPPSTATSYPGLGVRASLPMSLLDRWLLLGTLVSALSAFRTVFRKGSLFDVGPPRPYRW